jgi:hypothetical protein
MREDCLQGAADGSDTIPTGVFDTIKLIFYGRFRQGTSKYWKEHTVSPPEAVIAVKLILSTRTSGHLTQSILTRSSR